MRKRLRNLGESVRLLSLKEPTPLPACLSPRTENTVSQTTEPIEAGPLVSVFWQLHQILMVHMLGSVTAF